MSTYMNRIQNKMQGNKLKRSESWSSYTRNEDEARCVIEELKEKMSRLKFRLLDCQNQNQMLRKELRLAKKVVNTEVSLTPYESFGDLLNQSTSTDYRGRREKILLLKDKLSELQNRIKEIEDGNMDKLSEISVKTQKIERIEDEKFQSKQMMDKELQYLLENSCQMKRKLEVWKKRTAEQSKEAELLRLELDRLLEKNKEDKDVHESYHAVEKELRARQNEKLDLRTKLDCEKTRNEQLVEELASAKEDISLILSKINDDKLLIEALKNQQGYLHDLLDREKMISENDNRRFKEDLKEIQLRHTTNCDMLDQIKNIVGEKRVLCELLQHTLNQKFQPLIDEEKHNEVERSTESITIESEHRQDEPPQQPEPTSDSNPDTSEEPLEAESELAKLTQERDQCADLFRSSYEEMRRQTDIVSKNSERLNEWMAQLFQSRLLLAQKNAEIYGLQETAKRLEKTLSSTKKLGTSSQNCSRFEAELKETNDVLSEEYQILLCLWELLMTNKENSIVVFLISIDSARRLFAEAINDLILLEDKLIVDEQQCDNEEVERDEANPTAE